MLTQVEKSTVTRRALLSAVGAALVNLSLKTESVSGEDAEFSFYAGRSGRLNRGQVLVGGILSMKGEAKALESQIGAIATRKPGPPALHFSTSSKNAPYFSDVADLLSRRKDIIFSVTNVFTPSWPSDPLFWKSRRQDAELKIFEEVASNSKITIHTLKHDYDQDEEIYASVSERLKGRTNFAFHNDVHTSPLLLQISGFLTKALNQPDRLHASENSTKGARNKSELVRIAYDIFGVKNLKEKSKTSIKLVYTELTL